MSKLNHLYYSEKILFVDKSIRSGGIMYWRSFRVCSGLWFVIPRAGGSGIAPKTHRYFEYKDFGDWLKNFKRFSVKSVQDYNRKNIKMRRHLFSFLSLCVSLSASLTPSLSLSLSLSLYLWHTQWEEWESVGEIGQGNVKKDMFERFDKVCFVFQSSFFSNKTLFKLVTLRPFRWTVLFDQK